MHLDEHSAESISHISTMKTLLSVFAALIVLTAVTVAIGQIHLGSWNIIIALFIATIKASLVALYFMHLRYDRGFIRITFFVSILFFGLFLGVALMDSEQYQQDIKWQESLPQP